MEIPASYLDRFQVNTATEHRPRTEREELLDRFLARLNPARTEANLKPLSYAGLAAKLAKIPTGDLHSFYQNCDRARSFSRLFWHLLKPKA